MFANFLDLLKNGFGSAIPTATSTATSTLPSASSSIVSQALADTASAAGPTISNAMASAPPTSGYTDAASQIVADQTALIDSINPLQTPNTMPKPTDEVAKAAADKASTLDDITKYMQIGSAGMGMGMSVYQMLEARKRQNAEKINRNPLVTRWT